MADVLMSALWTLGRRPGQLRQSRVGGAEHSHPTAGSLLSWNWWRFPLSGRFWRLCGARRSWFDVGAGALAAPVAREARDAPYSGAAVGGILRVRGHFCAAGDR